MPKQIPLKKSQSDKELDKQGLIDLGFDLTTLNEMDDITWIDCPPHLNYKTNIRSGIDFYSVSFQDTLVLDGFVKFAAYDFTVSMDCFKDGVEKVKDKIALIQKAIQTADTSVIHPAFLFSKVKKDEYIEDRSQAHPASSEFNKPRW